MARGNYFALAMQSRDGRGRVFDRLVLSGHPGGGK
jgi:hypothetical protein